MSGLLNYRYYVARHAQYAQAWDSNSFLVLSDTPSLLQVFDDLDLQPDSQELALNSLLRFLDVQCPDGYSFLALKARDLKRMGRKWLESGEGRRFWGEDESHIRKDEMSDLWPANEYPGDKPELFFNMKELLGMMKPKIRQFHWMRERYTVEGEESRLRGDESEDETARLLCHPRRLQPRKVNTKTTDEENHKDKESEDENTRDEEDDEDELGEEDGEDEDDEEDGEPAKIIGQKRKRSDEDSEDERPRNKKVLTIRTK